MTTERELIKRLRDTIAEIDKHMYPSQGLGDWAMSTAWERPDIEGQLDEADAYLAAPVAPAGIAPKDCVWARNGHQVCPSSPVAPALVPLTDADIEDGSAEYMVDDFLDFRAGVKFAERRHGIKP